MTPDKVISCPICGPEVDFEVRYPAKLNAEALNFSARKTPDSTHFRIVRCRGCGMVYSTPIFDESIISDLYRHSEFIDEPQIENMVSDYAEELRRIGPWVSTGRLLEVGCANGVFLERAKALGFDAYGFEPGKAAVNSAPAPLRDRIVNDFLKPGYFPSESFDVVCFFQIFEHILDPNALLTTVRDYLRKGGVVMSVHHNIEAPMPRLLGERASTYDLEHIYYWDHRTMRRILEKHGFEVLKIENTANRYQVDHVLRMLPLPAGCKRGLRWGAGKMGLSRWSIRAKVENMVSVARKT